jgi:GTP-binding protein
MWNGQGYTLIDTAGLIRKAKNLEGVDFFSSIRAMRSVVRADICLVLLDTSAPLTTQDIRLAHYPYEMGKGTIIIGNKWDLVKKETNTMKHFETELDDALRITPPLPVIFVSALTGKRIHRIMDVVREVSESYFLKIQTAMLNDLLISATTALQPPVVRGKRIRLLYAVQDKMAPPSILIFTNTKNALPESYMRYLSNYLKRALNLSGIPLKIKTRRK